MKRLFLVSLPLFLASCSAPTEVSETPNFGEQIQYINATEERTSSTQDEWLIEWSGTSTAEFYVTYGTYKDLPNGNTAERSATFDGIGLPTGVKFFLEPGPNVTATLNLIGQGQAIAQIYKNGQLCDEASQLGQDPAIRATCFYE